MSTLMNRINWRAFLVVFSLLAMLIAIIAVIIPSNSSNHKLTIQNGQLDLATWQVNEGVQSLDGEWEFYWKQLLLAEDFRKSDSSLQRAQFVNVPSTWNKYQVVDETMGDTGVATYKITVSTPQVGQELALRLMGSSIAYEVYIDDKQIASSGRIGTDINEFKPGRQPLTVQFTTPSTQFDLILHIANVHYPSGGLTQSILLGTPQQITDLNNVMVYRDLFLIGVFVIAFLFSLFVFFMNRQEKVSLYFALICFIFIGRVITTGSCFIYVLSPSASLDMSIFINYFTSHVGSLAVALMINELFPSLFSRRIRRYFVAMTVIILLLITIVPEYLYSHYYILSDIFCLIPLGYACYVSVKALMRKQALAVLVYIANVLSILLITIDFYLAAITEHRMAVEFSTTGFFLFILLYAIIIGRKFSLAFSEIKILSGKLMELDKLKDQFLANTSHELRTPLHGIISIADSLLSGVAGKLNKSQANNVSLIASSGRKLSHLIDDILDMSQLKYTQIVLNRSNVQLAPLLESIVHIIKQVHQNKPILWSVNIAEPLPTLYGDENRIVQMLYNVIGNAAKFTDSGEINIDVKQSDRFIVITVTDTGSGISSDKLEMIFQPFEQGDASITRPHGGVGLGLSITKQLIELHGGSIGVSSTPAIGSSFTISLPISSEQIEKQDKVEAGSMSSYLDYSQQHTNQLSQQSTVIDSENDFSYIEGDGEHVLVVDDDFLSLQAGINLLKLDGYKITAVTNGKDALQKVKEYSDLRLVIVDVMMPGISGYEVCKEIRKTYSIVDLPILMVTAKNLAEDLVRGYEVGANDFLVKPFEPMEFRARVRTLVEWKQSMNRAIQSELAFLQAQIKPHFIYNTLNTISYFCTSDGEKAKELLNNFAYYLRTHFDFKDLSSSIMLDQEIQVVKSYLDIEKERFRERLQIQYDIDSEALAVQVPPFILQPVVENAVLHGVLKKVEGGLVSISIRIKAHTVQISVYDNGVGMNSETVEGLLTGSMQSGIGLSNIRERLKKLYDTQLSINSREGEGTEVMITIPINKGD